MKTKTTKPASMKKIQVRKAGTVRLTSAACECYHVEV
ncbi:hypothetical protein Actkin_02474 [Actinokineospora sp. UTMC 2448]|nr:hypothetical protein Actkin_02474 [Actinokineospora sp. UTMC 2448]